MSALVALLALLDLMLGVGFLVNPAASGADFGLSAVATGGGNGAEGLSAMRADFTAFFVVAALFMGLGAWRRRGDVLTMPLALFAIAFTGRLVNLLVVGSYEGWWLPMLVELGHVAILALAIKVWPWRRRRSKFRVG
ncbi:MAG: hypothetical protein MK010_00235 [Erythrobacter sp.]|nr:hypothetical protein [Erythrobacter sp.]